MQEDANLVVYTGGLYCAGDECWDSDLQALWASNTWQRYPVGATPCYMSSKLTKVESNYDHAGGDYAAYSLRGWGPTLCEYYCATDSRCKAFTFVPTGASTAVCWLKSVVLPRVYRPGMVTGTIYTSIGR